MTADADVDDVDGTVVDADGTVAAEEEEAARFHALLASFEGQPAATAGRGKDAVNKPMIRHWCEAMGDANPAYTGPDAVAPPTMLQAWTMGGLSGHADRSSAYDELLTLLDGSQASPPWSPPTASRSTTAPCAPVPRSPSTPSSRPCRPARRPSWAPATS